MAKMTNKKDEKTCLFYAPIFESEDEALNEARAYAKAESLDLKVCKLHKSEECVTVWGELTKEVER
jgi:hypothetical protein